MNVSPSGAQLELARRVGVPGLDEELLRTPPVGRGRPDPPLPGRERPGGLLAEAPEDAPATELLRVAVGFLAARLVEAPPVPEVPPARRGLVERLRRRHRPYVVLGRSLTAEVVRVSLVGAGGIEGGRRPVSLVVGDPLEGLVQGAWTRHVRSGSGQRWRRAWSILEAQLAHEPERLPRALDLPGLARAADARAETHLLLLPGPSAARAAAGLVGLTLGAPAELPSTHDPGRVDLLRRIHQALGTRLDRSARAGIAPRLDGWLVDGRLDNGVTRPAYRLAPPPEQAEQAVDLGRRLADGLRAVQSATVHGDAAYVVPSCVVRAPRTVPADLALERALQAIRAAAIEGGA